VGEDLVDQGEDMGIFDGVDVGGTHPAVR